MLTSYKSAWYISVSFLVWWNEWACGNPAESTNVIIPALGRSFHLGSYYNLQNNKISGEGLHIHFTRLEEKYSSLDEDPEFKIFDSSLLDKKIAFFMDVNDTNLNWLIAGLYSEQSPLIKGSAKILRSDHTLSKNEVALALKFEKKTKSVHNKNQDTEKVLNATVLGQVTHFVNKITYGISAVFEFRMKFETQQDQKQAILTLKQELEKQLGNITKEKSVPENSEKIDTNKMYTTNFNSSTVFDSISTTTTTTDLDIDKMNSTNFNLTDNSTATELLNQFTCNFYGNLKVDLAPTNFQGCMETLKMLSSNDLLTSTLIENAEVPLTVQLKQLNSRLAPPRKRYNELDPYKNAPYKMLDRIKLDHNNYISASINLTGIIESVAYIKFKLFKTNVDLFLDYFNNFKYDFGYTLPSILEKNDGHIDYYRDEINEKGRPFLREYFPKWLNSTTADAALLSELCEMELVTFMSSSAEKIAVVWSHENSYVVILTLMFFKGKDQCFTIDPFSRTNCIQNGSMLGINKTNAELYKRRFEQFKNLHSNVALKSQKIKSYADKFRFAIHEVPLSNNQSPVASLEIYKNGVLLGHDLYFPKITGLTAVFQKCNKTLLVSWNYERLYNSSLFPNNNFFMSYTLSFGELRNEYRITGIKDTRWEIQKHFEDQNIAIRIKKTCIFGYCAEANANFTIKNRLNATEVSCPHIDYECAYTDKVVYNEDEENRYNPFLLNGVFATPKACCSGCGGRGAKGFSFNKEAGYCVCKYDELIKYENSSYYSGEIKLK